MYVSVRSFSDIQYKVISFWKRFIVFVQDTFVLLSIIENICKHHNNKHVTKWLFVLEIVQNRSFQVRLQLITEAS